MKYYRYLNDKEALSLERTLPFYWLLCWPRESVSSSQRQSLSARHGCCPQQLALFKQSRRNDGNGRREQRDQRGQVRPWQSLVYDPLFAVTWQATSVPSLIGPLEFSGSKRIGICVCILFSLLSWCLELWHVASSQSISCYWSRNQVQKGNLACEKDQVSLWWSQDQKQASWPCSPRNACRILGGGGLAIWHFPSMCPTAPYPWLPLWERYILLSL